MLLFLGHNSGKLQERTALAQLLALAALLSWTVRLDISYLFPAVLATV